MKCKHTVHGEEQKSSDLYALRGHLGSVESLSSLAPEHKGPAGDTSALIVVLALYQCLEWASCHFISLGQGRHLMGGCAEVTGTACAGDVDRRRDGG